MISRVRPALNYQHPRAPLRVLADDALRPLTRDLKVALALAGSLIDQQRAAYLIANGRWGEVPDAIDWTHYREVLKQPLGRLADVLLGGATVGATKVTRAFSARGRRVRYRKDVRGIGDRFDFDRFDATIQAAIRAYQDRFIVGLEADARATIEQVIIRGVRAGLTPERMVDDIRQVIGLTDRQAMAVLNYRDMLQRMDPQALSRQLSSSADDRTLRGAIEAGAPLDQATVDRMVRRYAEAYLDHRARSIAQTEATRASNAGLQQSYQQAVDRGALPIEAISQHWQVALDERTCGHCLSVPDLNRDGVPLGEDFDSSDGPVSAPPLHPNCRCSLELITDLDLVPEQAPPLAMVV